MSKTFKIRARSLDTAMRRAKVQFGADAMVVDTRHLRVKDPEKMGLIKLVELTVRPGSLQNCGQPDSRLARLSEVTESGTEPGAYAGKLQLDIERIEKLIQSVAQAGRKLEDLDRSYPLGNALLGAGVTRGAVRVLQNAFEEKVPASERRNPAEAMEHLRGYLNCVHPDAIDDMSGTHLFLGSAGSGKTSLVINLASALSQHGKRVAIVVAAPYHAGEIRRVEAAASALMIDAAVANDAVELERTLRYYAEKTVVLVDTPCWMSPRRGAAADLMNALKSLSEVYKHYVCALTSDFSFVLKELEAWREWNCDFLALSKVDMMPRAGKIVDLALSRRITFSFLSREAASRGGVEVASQKAIVDLVLSGVRTGDASVRTADATGETGVDR